MPCQKQVGDGFQPAPGECQLSLELAASTSSQHTQKLLTSGPSARTCLLWATADFHGHGGPVPISRWTDLLHAKQPSHPACTGALRVGLCVKSRRPQTQDRNEPFNSQLANQKDLVWTLTGLNVTSGHMGSSLEKRTDNMLQALKGPKAWDRRRSNYPHLAGQLFYNFANVALASHTYMPIGLAPAGFESSMPFKSDFMMVLRRSSANPPQILQDCSRPAAGSMLSICQRSHVPGQVPHH